jgi:hypothetical protein
MSNGSWRVDETYIKVKGRWTYLYRAVDKCGQAIDFLLSAKRDAAAAKRFFCKALAQPHTVNPRTIPVDKNPSYPKAPNPPPTPLRQAARRSQGTVSGFLQQLYWDGNFVSSFGLGRVDPNESETWPGCGGPRNGWPYN